MRKRAYYSLKYKEMAERRNELSEIRENMLSSSGRDRDVLFELWETKYAEFTRDVEALNAELAEFLRARDRSDAAFGVACIIIFIAFLIFIVVSLKKVGAF